MPASKNGQKPKWSKFKNGQFFIKEAQQEKKLIFGIQSKNILRLSLLLKKLWDINKIIIKWLIDLENY